MHVGLHGSVEPVRLPEAREREGKPRAEASPGAPEGATTVAISGEARAVAEGEEARGEDGERSPEEEGAVAEEAQKARAAATEQGDEAEPSDELSPEEQEQVQELRARDREVRAHEQAHAAVAGALGGAPSYDFQTGPDGKRYAVGGEVSIKVGKGKTPEETLQKAAQIRAAALAPAEPSGQDQSVAARAQALATEARAELAEERKDQVEESKPATSEPEAAETKAAEGTEATDEAEGAEASPPPEPPEPPPPPSTPRFRPGGVGGGHVHMSMKCPTCTAGIAKYKAG